MTKQYFASNHTLISTKLNVDAIDLDIRFHCPGIKKLSIRKLGDEYEIAWAGDRYNVNHIRSIFRGGEVPIPNSTTPFPKANQESIASQNDYFEIDQKKEIEYRNKMRPYLRNINRPHSDYLH